MREYIARRKDYKNFWMTTNSFYTDRWHNCLYLHFLKEEFDFLNYPKLELCPYEKRKFFNYNNCDLAKLDWHGGITFYEEIIDIQREHTIVKAGCDFVHYGDDYFMMQDSGKELLNMRGDLIAKEFIKLCESKKTENIVKE